MNYSIIIPNFNGVTFLTDCLKSLKVAFKNLPSAKFEIILVDNGSSDNSLEVFDKLTKNIPTQIIKNPTNLGFAPAVNQGIKAAKHEYVCLTNNDLTVSPDWFVLIDKQIKKADSNTVTFCGTVLTKDGKYYESVGLDFEYRGKCTNKLNRQPFDKKALPNNNQFIWGSPAALVVYKKTVLEQIGLFDEHFVAYEEDVDLALRLHKLSYKTLFIPQAISYHLGSGTSGRMGNFRNIHDCKNWIFIIIKDYSSQEIFKYLPSIIEERLRNLSGLIKTTISIYKLKSFYLLPLSIHKAYFPVLKNLNLMIDKRRKFQNLLKSTNDNRH